MLWGLWARAAVLDVQCDRLHDDRQCEWVDLPDPIWSTGLVSCSHRPGAAHDLVRWPH
jgi:hypothetical protein